MKKTLVAIAALAASVGAMAQSSVTLFGIADATLAYGSGSLTKKTQITNSGLNSSRFGVRGREDIGGGMFGSFHLEAGMNNDNGSFGTTGTDNQGGTSGGGGLAFNRRSTVGLGGGFGEVRLGREYTPHFWNHTVYDPFGTNGVGTSQVLNGAVNGGPTTVRASNSITYLTPNLGGFSGEVQLYLGENSKTAASLPAEKNGNGFSTRLGYANGPISAHLGLGSTKAAPNNVKTTNIGASYDLGVAKLSALYNKDTNGTANDKGFLFGVNAPVGPGEIRAAYSTSKTNAAGNPTANKLALGYVYNMSKRTALYTTFASVKNKNGAAFGLNGATTAANASSNGLDLGVRHSF